MSVIKPKDTLNKIALEYSKKGLLRPYALDTIKRQLDTLTLYSHTDNEKSQHMVGRVGFVDFVLDSKFMSFQNDLKGYKTHFEKDQYNADPRSFDSIIFDIFD